MGNNLTPIESSEENLVNPAKPYIMEDYHKEYRKKYHIIVGIVTAVFAAIICVGLLGSWIVGIYMSDLNQKAIQREEKLETQEEDFQEKFDTMVEKFRSTNEQNYDYDKVINELYDLNRFRDEVNEADWNNIYNGTVSEKKEDILNQIKMKYEQLASMIVNDFENQIKVLEVDPIYFDEEGNPVDKKLPSAKEMHNGMATLTELIPKILYINNDYDLYSYEDFKQIIERLSKIEGDINKLYYAASDNELTAKAKEEADKKFEENKDAIREELNEELTNNITEELSGKYEREKLELTRSKDSEITSLKKENEFYKNQIETLQKEVDELKKTNEGEIDEQPQMTE